MWAVNKGMEWEFCPQRGPMCWELYTSKVCKNSGEHNYRIAQRAATPGEGSESHRMAPVTEFKYTMTESLGPAIPSPQIEDSSDPEDLVWHGEFGGAKMFKHPISEHCDYCLPPDPVNHPSHYTQYPVEVIEITERLSFLMGNIVKYVLRADYKGKPIEDLKKARWYLDREIQRRESQ